MSDMWALALGILFLAVWVAFMYYYDSAHRSYVQGRMDQIRHKNRCPEYHGIAAMLYKRGRRDQAMRHKIVVRSRMSRNGYGTYRPQ